MDSPALILSCLVWPQITLVKPEILSMRWLTLYDPPPLRLASPSNLALKMSSSSDSPPSYRTSLNGLPRSIAALEEGF